MLAKYLKTLLVLISLLNFFTIVHADENVNLSYAIKNNTYINSANATIDDPFANDPTFNNTTSGSTTNSLDGAKIHEILGLTSFGLGILTFLTAGDAEDREEENAGAHQYLGIAAVATAVAAATSGIMYHWDEIYWADGFSNSSNVHMLLASIGTVAFALAASSAPDNVHSAAGAIGGISMGIAIAIKI